MVVDLAWYLILDTWARTAGSNRGCRPGLGSSVAGSSGPCVLVSVEDSSSVGSTVEVGSNVEGSPVEGLISHGSSVTEYKNSNALSGAFLKRNTDIPYCCKEGPSPNPNRPLCSRPFSSASISFWEAIFNFLLMPDVQKNPGIMILTKPLTHVFHFWGRLSKQHSLLLEHTWWRSRPGLQSRFPHILVFHYLGILQSSPTLNYSLVKNTWQVAEWGYDWA